MSELSAARAQMGTSLAFHIVWACLGVGLPFMMFIAEGIGLFRHDHVWYALARRWSLAFAIIYAIGAVSGTIIEFELGLLWPNFMKFSGGIIGYAFAMEAFAFFTEGIFLGLYLFGWKRLSPMAHWLCSIPLWVAGLASSEFVTAANAWMNTPTGFTMRNGQITNVDPLGAILNPYAPTETFHMTLAGYEATAFGVAAIYGWAILRGRRNAYTRNGLFLGMALGTIVAPVQVWVGDVNAELVATYQPIKLAAMEGVWKTQTCAAETFGGWPNMQTHTTPFGIKIPCLLSWLAYHDVSHPVLGLDSVASYFWPMVPWVHLGWQLMLFIGSAAAAMTGWFWLSFGWRYIHTYLRRVRERAPLSSAMWLDGRVGKITLWSAVLLGPLTFLAVECGWMVTEMGRQPWVVYGYVLTEQAVQPAPWLNVSFSVFSGVYVLLAITTTVLLLRLRQQPPDGKLLDLLRRRQAAPSDTTPELSSDDRPEVALRGHR